MPTDFGDNKLALFPGESAEPTALRILAQAVE